MTRLAAEYVLPLKWSDDAGLAELTDYLRILSQWIDVTVVDGSDPARFAAHAAAWAGLLRHMPVSCPVGANGKVRGVLTGVGMARHENIVVADDDIRYDRHALNAVVGALAGAALVRPQNYFSPLPWHARWDTGRALLNRAFAGDYPGTYALRRTALESTGGYDADVLFENLELERTLRAAGHTVLLRRDILVARRPPTTAHFVSQRVRQAYDDLAQPGRLVAEAALLPLAVTAALRRPRALAVTAAAAVLTAELGRRRDGGAAVFPATSALWAPAWLCERSITIWLALGLRTRGGVRYAGRRLVRAATPMRVLRTRHARTAVSVGAERP